MNAGKAHDGMKDKGTMSPAYKSYKEARKLWTELAEWHMNQAQEKDKQRAETLKRKPYKGPVA